MNKQKHIGNLEITKENEKEFTQLKEVTGYVYVSGSAKLDAPKLETVGGDVYVYGSAKLDALETVGGDVYVSGSAKLDAPNIKLKNTKEAKKICSDALSLAFRIKGLIRIDGILSWILKEKTVKGFTVFQIKIVGKTTLSFCIKQGDKYAHGETIEQAKEDLKYKCADRDVSEFKKWRNNLDKKVSFEDAIAAYRTVTGACEFGVKEFVKSIEIPKRITPNIIIELTQGKYGHREFSNFLLKDTP